MQKLNIVIKFGGTIKIRWGDVKTVMFYLTCSRICKEDKLSYLKLNMYIYSFVGI